MGTEGWLLEAAEAHRALRDHLAEEYDAHYSLISSIFVGVVLSTAAIALVAILGSGEAGVPKAAALALWLASFTGVLTVYNGYLVDSILIDQPPNVVDVLVPFASGIVQFAQFASLVPLTTAAGGPASSPAQLKHLAWWFLCSAALAATGVVTQLNLVRHMRRTQAVCPPEVAALVDWCADQAGRGLVASGSMGGLCLVVFVLAQADRPPIGIRAWQGPLGVVFTLASVGAIALEERGRQYIVATVATGPEEGDWDGEDGEDVDPEAER